MTLYSFSNEELAWWNIIIIVPIALFFLSFAILQMVTEGRAFVHMGWTSIAFAAYAFYKIIMAIYNVMKARKQEDFTVLALRNIGLADAFVSILALQTALLHTFSDPGMDISLFNTFTGTAVSLFSLGLSVSMIVRGSKIIKEIENGK